MIENWASKLEARALLAAVFTAYWLRHSQATWSLGNNMSNTWAAWSVARQDFLRFLVTSVSQCGLCSQLLLATPLALGSCQTVLQRHGATRKNIGTATPICHICHICHICQSISILIWSPVHVLGEKWSELHRDTFCQCQPFTWQAGFWLKVQEDKNGLISKHRQLLEILGWETLNFSVNEQLDQGKWQPQFPLTCSTWPSEQKLAGLQTPGLIVALSISVKYWEGECAEPTK